MPEGEGLRFCNEIGTMNSNFLSRRLALFLALAFATTAGPAHVAGGDSTAVAQYSRLTTSVDTNLPTAACAPVAPPSSPLFAGLFQDIVGNRTRIIQASFICIVIGIFILWKK